MVLRADGSSGRLVGAAYGDEGGACVPMRPCAGGFDGAQRHGGELERVDVGAWEDLEHSLLGFGPIWSANPQEGGREGAG